MTNREQKHTLSPADAAQLCELWSGHLDSLERHLSAKTWALWAVTVVVVAYPIARILIPAVLHDIMSIVPGVVQTVLRWI